MPSDVTPETEEAAAPEEPQEFVDPLAAEDVAEPMAAEEPQAAEQPAERLTPHAQQRLAGYAAFEQARARMQDDLN
ncbi:hypothetical protein, partial [Salmonella sp. SAL4448]|uniref:hypothetical protein n=1 Tax=Salmonella sp. SAL4448 TaxID=3159903 RepID=UPI00397A6339